MKRPIAFLLLILFQIGCDDYWFEPRQMGSQKGYQTSEGWFSYPHPMIKQSKQGKYIVRIWERVWQYPEGAKPEYYVTLDDHDWLAHPCNKFPGSLKQSRSGTRAWADSIFEDWRKNR